MDFLERKCMDFDLNFTVVSYHGSSWQYSSVSDNDLAPTKQQAIIWTNGYQFNGAFMLQSASMI